MKKWILWSVFILFLFAFLVPFTVILKPDILINSNTLNWIQSRYLNDDLNWSKADIKVINHSFWEKSFEVDFEGLGINMPAIKGGIEKLNASAQVRLAPWNFKILKVGPLAVHKPHLDLEMKKEETPRKGEPFNLREALESYASLVIDRVEVREIEIGIVSEQEKQSISGGLLLSGLNANGQDKLTIDLIHRKEKVENVLHAELKISEYKTILDPSARIDFDAKVSSQDILLMLKGIVRPTDAKKQKWVLESKAKVEEVTVIVDVEGFRDGQRFDSDLNVVVSNLSKQLPQVDLQPCRFAASWGAKVTDDINVELSCRSKVKRGKSVHEKVVGLFMSESTPFDFLSTLVYQPSKESMLVDAEINLDHDTNDAVQLEGSIKMAARIPLGEEVKKEFFQFDSRVKLNVPKFESLVGKLRNTVLAVPAPANQLKGPVSCLFEGDFSTQRSLNEFPFECDLKLKSLEQKMFAESKGLLKLENSKDGMIPDLKLDVKIDGIDLVLPTISLTDGAPAIKPDPRIVLKSKQEFKKTQVKNKKEKNLFRYSIRVQTKKNDSIKIHSNLAKTPMPISVDVKLSDKKPLQGEVLVNNFTVELMRRKAVVRYFDLKLAPEAEEQKIKGEVVFPNNDYVITLKIFGSAAYPEYTFQSEPPLDQNQLMAILLFGKLPDSLDADKQKTAEETRAAVADGAVNLLSMYYLAATPVESVGYNPHSGVFSAKISLQDGLSMTVGTDAEDQREVGLRRRLGNGWSIETMAISNQETSSRKGVAMLKWGKRY